MALTLRRDINRRLTHEEMDDNWAGLADGSLITGGAAITDIDSANVDFAQSGSGAVATTVQDVARLLGKTPQQFGAVADGTTDDTAAVQAAITAAGAGYVYFPPGTYRITSTLTVSTSGAHLVGHGRAAVKLKFAPTATDVLLSFTAGASMIRNWSLRNLTLYSEDSTYTKTALEIIDGGEYYVDNVEIGGNVTVGSTNFWSGNSATSIGIHVKGREAGVFNNVWSVADRPLLIGVNPNSAIDIDHHNFHNFQMIGNGNPLVEIASDVALTNVSFTGYQAWVLGTHGLYWVDTTTAANGYQLVLENVRREQAESATAYGVRIEHNNALQSLSMRNCVWDPTQECLYLRKVLRVSYEDSSYGGGSGRTAINMTFEANSVLDIRNSLLGNSATATLTNAVRVFETRPTQTTYNFGEYALYTHTNRAGLRQSIATSLPTLNNPNLDGTYLLMDPGTGQRSLALFSNSGKSRIRADGSICELYDDFLGDVLADQWNGRVGSDPQCVTPTINVQAQGIVRLTSGNDAAASMSVNGCQLESVTNWRASTGNLMFECRLALSSAADVCVYIGFTDQAAALEMPFTYSGTTLTSNATNAVGVLYDTDATTDNWKLVGVAADVDATVQDAGTAPAGGGTNETWRVELTTGGVASFFRNGVAVGTAMSGAVTASTLLTPVVAIFSRTTASKIADVDYVLCQMNR